HPFALRFLFRHAPCVRLTPAGESGHRPDGQRRAKPFYCMGINIGLDIGAVSLKLAAVGAPQDGALLARLTERNPNGFFPAEVPATSSLAGRPLVFSRYRRIQGTPMQSTFDLLKELY